MQLDPRVDFGADRAGPGKDLVGKVEWVDIDAGATGGRPRIQLQVKRGDDAKKARTGAAGGPVQIGVIVCVAMDLRAVGGDDVQANHALARRAVDPAVPAVSALQQITSETDSPAVATREEQALRLQFGHEHAAALPWTDDRAALIGVDGGVVYPAHVEQHSAIAQMAGGKTVPTGHDAHLMAIDRGVADGADNVVSTDSLNDHLGVAIRYAPMPHGAAASRLVPVTAPEEVPPGR
ncbi:Uncharacterised protein [Mycobacterium tuberculosis]|nr:Uncharacterised protein [Mycobacterium tuberculosis]